MDCQILYDKPICERGCLRTGYDTTTGDEDGMTTNTIGQVEPFQQGVDDWEQYTERLEQYFIANGIEGDNKKLAVFLTVVGAKTYALLSNLVAPSKPASKTYAELKEVLQTHLKPKPLIIAERFKFHQRKQGEGESVPQYMAELRKLADRCEFGAYLQEALRDRLVCGLRSEAIQRRLLTEDKLTLEKAYGTAHGMEAAQRQASELQASGPQQTADRSVQFLGARSKTTVEGSPNSGSRKTAEHATCYRCGKSGHSPDSCFYKRQKCRACGKKGHIACVCKSTRTHLVGQEDEEQDHNNGSEELPLLRVERVNPVQGSGAGFRVGVRLEGKPLEMELDTGAAVSLIAEGTWKQLLQEKPLEPAAMKLKTYSGEELEVLGQLVVRVRYGAQESKLPLIVVKGQGPSLFGRNWLKEIQIDWGSIHTVTTRLDTVLAKYQSVFKEELGTLKGIQASLEVEPNSKPRFHRPRSVPYALKDAIEQDLERLEREGIIEKVAYSDWAAPVVPVPKADGGLRLCGDYKVTVNPVLKVNQYPMPTPEDLFATLAGGQTFTKLDLSHAYLQVLLEPDSRKYATINTHKGLYQYQRLPFGIASAPAVFQEIMEKILQGIPGVIVYIDNILVSGKNEEEHLEKF